MQNPTKLLLLDPDPAAPLRDLVGAAGLAHDHSSDLAGAQRLFARGAGHHSALLVQWPGRGAGAHDGPALASVLRSWLAAQPDRPVLLVVPEGAPLDGVPAGVTCLDGWPSADGLRATLRDLTAYRGAAEPVGAPQASLGTLTLDQHRREVRLDGQTVTLTAKEYLLLELLAGHRGRLFRRDEILERIWGLEFVGDDRIVDAYIKRLRKKVGEAAVETVRGLGYRCPEATPARTEPRAQQPHFQRLPLEARLMTLLAERVLRVGDPQDILEQVQELLSEAYDVAAVSLLDWPPDGASARRVHAGAAPSEHDLARLHRLPLSGVPVYQARDAGASLAGVALIPLAAPLSAQPWGALAYWGAYGLRRWDEATCSALEAVTALVSPALRLNREIARREHAELQVRRLNSELEDRIDARTRDLEHAKGQTEALYALSQRLEHARSVTEVAAEGLPALARMAGAEGAVLWWLRAGGAEVLAAHAAGGQAWAPDTWPPSLDGETPGGSATCAGRRLRASAEHLVVLTAAGAGGPDPDASLLEAAARSFGLALERRLHAQHMEQAALTDEFSGLPNRRAFLADLTAEVAFSARHGHPLSVSFFEIRNIRQLNAALGYAGGNDLIRALALALRGALRLEDRAYRVSGATFAALLPQRGEGSPAASLPAIAGRLNGLLGGMVGDFTRQTGAQVVLGAAHLSCPHDADNVAEVFRLGLERLDSGGSDIAAGRPGGPTLRATPAPAPTPAGAPGAPERFAADD